MADKINLDEFGFEELVLTKNTPTKGIDAINALNPKMLTPRVADALAISGQEKLLKIRDELDALYLERSHVIDDSMVALIVGQSVLLLGPPGTGKTAYVNDLCKRITDANFFGWLLNKTSDPAEILGPYSLKAMENDKFLRKTAGKLPEAHLAMIDEVNLGLLV